MGVNPENNGDYEAEGGLTWSRYGISEILNYIQNQSINLNGDDETLHRSAVLRFSNSTNFGARTQSTLTSFNNAPLNPTEVQGTQAGYVAGGGFSASRGEANSTLTYYAPYAELNCEFRVKDANASDTDKITPEVEAFFRACQSLGSYFQTRFSYHKPIEVKDFTIEHAEYSTTAIPDNEFYGHWRKALVDDATKHPSLIKYGDASYKPPTYFHINTNRHNGYFYCEANPKSRQGHGVEHGSLLPIREFGSTVSNSDCNRLNQVIGVTSAPNSITFEKVSEMSQSEREIQNASDLGFIGHKEGPYDFYHCKWRAPFKGNPLAE